MSHHSPTADRARVISRIVGAFAGMFVGTLYGLYVASSQNLNNRAWIVVVVISGMAIGLIALAVAAPLLSVEPYLWLENTLATAPAPQLIASIVGLLVALAISALLTVFLSALPWGSGYIISVSIAIALVYVGVRSASARYDVIAHLIPDRRAHGAGAGAPGEEAPAPQDGQPIVVDTSVLVDGRVVDVAATGFIQGRLIIATCVLEELQRLADAADAARRAKGRRGLDAVARLQKDRHVVVDIDREDFPTLQEVDARLIKLARLRGASLMTGDYNLNRLARIDGRRVLNLNELANAVKPTVSAGEVMRVTIVKEGRELQQGVGYLEDGTMVVVEGGRRHLERSVEVTVTSVLQTPQGRLIFAAAPGGEAPRARPGGRSGTPPKVVNT